MPGFGSGPFGHTPFGHFPWSRAVLFGLIPSIYKSQDAASGGSLEAFTQGLRPSFDNLQFKIQKFTDLREPLKVRSQYSEIHRLKLGPRLLPVVVPEQRGGDATVDALQSFHSILARFSAADLGKEITVRGSEVIGNNRVVVIVATFVNDPHTVLTAPQLQPDAGPLNWELRLPVAEDVTQFTVEVRGGDISTLAPGWLLSDGFASFEILDRRQFLVSGGNAFRTEQEGNDGLIDPGSFFRSAKLSISGSDAGKHLQLSGSSVAANNDKFEILSVDVSVSPPLVKLNGFVSPDIGPFHWALLPFGQLDLRGRAFIQGIIEQEGYDLSITASSDLVIAASGLFKDEVGATDVGKIFEIANSTLGQGGVFEVQAVVNANTVCLNHTFTGSETLAYWSLRTPTQTGDVEESGNDLVQVAFTPLTTTVRSVSRLFSPADEGRNIVVSEATVPTNNGTFSILSVLSDELIVINTAMTPEPGPFGWAVRSSYIGRVQVNAPSMLAYLAPDFGIAIDTQESEARQRSWVANVCRWIDRKGHELSYTILGLISGFNVTVLGLFRICQDTSLSLPAAHVFEVGDAAVGRSGRDGVLFAFGGVVHLSSLTAKFRAGDVGRQIRIRNAANPLNNALYSIAQYVSPTEVAFRPADLAITPEYGLLGTPVAPTLQWDIARLFTDLPNALPLMDEFNPDALTWWVANNPFATPPPGWADGLEDGVEITPWTFHLDERCWEQSFAAFVIVDVLSAIPITSTLWQVTVNGPANVVVAPGRWTLVTSTGQRFVLESVPVASLVGMGDLSVPATLADLNAKTFLITVFSTAYSVTFASPASAAAVVGQIAAQTSGLVVTLVAGKYLHLNTLYGEANTLVVGSGTANADLGFSATQVNSSYAFEVVAQASSSPASGQGWLEYSCTFVPTCCYCQASDVLVIAEEGTIASETGVAVESAFERVLTRLDEIVPAHVDLIPRFRQSLEATLSISCTIDPDHEIYASLIAPLTAYYDVLSGDVTAPPIGDVVADGALTVQVSSILYVIDDIQGAYPGSVANPVADNATNYVYLDIAATLVINTIGYPPVSIRLARVVASVGAIATVILEQIEPSLSNPSAYHVRNWHADLGIYCTIESPWTEFL